MQLEDQCKAYYAIVSMLFKIGKMSTVSNMFSTECKGTEYKRTDTGATTNRVRQAIVISNTEIFDICSNTEALVIVRILSELKAYNALWYCNPKYKKSSSFRAAIKGLADKNILKRTDTTNIYIVNPLYIRRGDMFGVLATTAYAIMDCKKLTTDHVRDLRPVKNANFSAEQFMLLNNPDLVQDN